MKVDILTLENKVVDSLELDARVFGVDIKDDIIHRVAMWQLAKRRSGNHKTKGISEISGTTRKPWKQKGTGRARQGSLRSPQFRGGAVIFGPVVRSHAYDLPKKVRKAGLLSALSLKAAEGSIKIFKDIDLTSHKTKDLKKSLNVVGVESALFIDEISENNNFALACRNIYEIDFMPEIGVNVHDIIKHKYLCFTQSAMNKLVSRLTNGD
jgi:large subunit ribosomal protein L4